MATLLFKGETLKVRVTHNVISEFIRLNGTSFAEVMNMTPKDPMGWMRDILFCSLRVYNPQVLGEMTKWEVGDELFKLTDKDSSEFLKALLSDFVLTTTGKTLEKVASEKK